MKQNKPKDASTVNVNGLFERRLRPAFEKKSPIYGRNLNH